MKSAGPILLIVAFLSGASCLIYELVWSRYLHLIFGVSTYALITVLVCFMLGLALGSWHVGRWIDRTGRAVRALMWLEIAVGIYILLSPWLYVGFASLSTAIVRGIGPESAMKHVVRFILSAIALAVPTYLMGGTLPAFVKITRPGPDDIGRDVGLLYALNTLGGAIGAFVTGFFLIRIVGLTGSLLIAAGLSFASAALMSLLSDPARLAIKSEVPKSEWPPSARAALMVLAISGFTALSYEVYWTRLLTFFFKDSIYDLTIVLTAFLSGIVLGGLIGAKIATDRNNSIFWLALAQSMIGLFALLGLLLVDQFPFWINDLQTNTAVVAKFGQGYWFMGNAIRFGCAFALMIVPTTLFGTTFPLVSRICTDGLSTVGSRIGLINCINTVGAAAGALVAGAVMIGLLGIRNSVIVTAFLNIAAALLLLANARDVRSSLLVTGSIVMSVIVTLALPSWDKRRMSTSFLDPHQVEKVIALRFYQEDAHGITAVVDLLPLDRRYLVTNRLYAQNTSDMMGLEDHRRLGHIPMLLHPAPQSVLAVGLGAGMTLRGIRELNPDSIDCVELSPAVIKAASQFAIENIDITRDPKIHFIVDDGRSFMGSTNATYDLIVMDIFFPMSSGSSTVFSREYFQLCKNRLRPGGMVCQWLPVHQLSLDGVKTILATFQTVFPHTSVWYGMIGDSIAVVGCIGSEKELKVDLAQLARRNIDPAAMASLQEVNLNNPSLLLSHFIMADAAVKAFCADHPIDTDIHPVIEFAAPMLSVQSSRQGAENLRAFSDALQDITPHLINGEVVLHELPHHVTAKQTIIQSFGAFPPNDLATQRRIIEEALSKDPLNADLKSVNERLMEAQ